MRRQELQSTYIPYEIWVEIRCKLPIKDLLKSRSVCKSWYPFSDYLLWKIQNLPVCGLILKDTTFPSATNDNCHLTYVSMGTKDIITVKTETFTNKLMTISSGFDRGSLRDLPFEFGSLASLCQGEFFTIHRGLILVVKNDFTLHVHNPATNQVFTLPISPSVELGVTIPPPMNKTGFIINDCPVQVSLCFQFLVVRLFPVHVEIYYSTLCKWCVFTWININVSDELVVEARWSYENYVFVYKTLTLFFLTNMDRGLAVGFGSVKSMGQIGVKHGRIKGDIFVYSFPLPRVVKGGFRNARLGEGQECLYLSYYDDNGSVWFWKRSGDRPSADDGDDTWILLLEIGKTARLTRSLESHHNRLFKVVKGGDTIIPIGFHPSFAIAFLYVKSCIVAYDLTNKILTKIAEINDQEYNSSAMVLPYIPFAVPFENSIPKSYRKIKNGIKFYTAD